MLGHVSSDWKRPGDYAVYFSLVQLLVALVTFTLAMISDCVVFSNCIPSMMRLPASSPLLFKVSPIQTGSLVVCLANILTFYFFYLHSFFTASERPNVSVVGFSAGLLSQICYFGMSTNEELINSYDLTYESFVDLYILASILHCSLSSYLRFSEFSGSRANALKVSVAVVMVSVIIEVLIKLLDFFRLTSIVFDRMSECLFVLVVAVYNATFCWDLVTISQTELEKVPKLNVS